MAKELSEEELEKRERAAAEREAKKRARELEKKRKEREEIRRLNAEIRSARRARLKASSAEAAKKTGAALNGGKNALVNGVNTVCDRLGNFYTRAGNAFVSFGSNILSLPVCILVSFGLLCFSAAIGGYLPFVSSKEVFCPYYQFYLCDFSACFCSRVIVGAVTALFLDKVSVAQMSAIANAAVVVSLVLTAVFAGVAARSGFRKGKLVPVLLALICVTDPVISQVNAMFLGTIDVYVLILFFLMAACFGTKAFYFAAPVLSFAAMTVHYHYFFSFFPAVAALFVYGVVSGENGKKTGYLVSGAGTAVVGCSSFIYFVFFAKDHLKCTAEEFYDRMLSRFDISPFRAEAVKVINEGDTILRNYFDYYIFGLNKGSYYYGSTSDFIGFLRDWREGNTAMSLYTKYFLIAAPLLAAFIFLWLRCAAKAKGARKLPYIAFACIIAALIPELFISTDVPRWIMMTLAAQFTLFFVVYAKGDEVLTAAVSFGNGRTAAVKRTAVLTAVLVYIAVMLVVGKDLPKLV